MNFKALKRKLEEIFSEHRFIDSIKSKKAHVSKVFLEECSNGTVISVSFPGYKACIKNNGNIVYDYRIDISKDGINTSLSHANIIIDIYNKIVHGGMSASQGASQNFAH